MGPGRKQSADAVRLGEVDSDGVDARRQYNERSMTEADLVTEAVGNGTAALGLSRGRVRRHRPINNVSADRSRNQAAEPTLLPCRAHASPRHSTGSRPAHCYLGGTLSGRSGRAGPGSSAAAAMRRSDAWRLRITCDSRMGGVCAFIPSVTRPGFDSNRVVSRPWSAGYDRPNTSAKRRYDSR